MVQRVVSLFTGIGGFELGFKGSQLEPVLLCEIDEGAASVLRTHFEGVDLHADVRALKSLPECEILVAGWPCQDLSQAGRTAGISGSQSGLVDEIFRLIDRSQRKPNIVLLENVAFALNLQRGAAVKHVTAGLEERGYRWAYRILDTLEFGLPQRRRRVFICGARDQDPTGILFDGLDRPGVPNKPATQIGFYWTEGNRGIGWTPDAVPPLKGGSALAIPSPPAIWHIEKGSFSLPSIEDAERLQGFPAGWTEPSSAVTGTDRARWRMVGNAVSVTVAQWLATRLKASISELPFDRDQLVITDSGTHNAAWGGPSLATQFVQRAHEGPSFAKRHSLAQFGMTATNPLSQRAAAGFLKRYEKSKLKVDSRLLSALQSYCN